MALMTDREAKKLAVWLWSRKMVWNCFGEAIRYKRSVRVGIITFKTARGPAHFKEYGRGRTWEEAFANAELYLKPIREKYEEERRLRDNSDSSS